MRHRIGCNDPSRRRQGGVVLFVALIVMVAMSLAGIALFRSMETSLSVVGNLAFGQAAIAPMNRAVEEAVHALFDATNLAEKVPDKNADHAALNYFASIQPGETPKGIPAALSPGVPGPSFAGTTKQFTDGADNRVSWIVERMCSTPIPPGSPPGTMLTICDMAAPKLSPGTTTSEEEKPTLPPVPFYRVTVRVDGPANTVSYAQAMLR